MDYRADDLEIQFLINKNDEELIEKLSFIYLVQMKFVGKEVEVGWFQYQGNDPYMRIVISLPDKDSHSNATDHCKQSLDRDGAVRAHYKGALDRADPGGRMATDMKKRALKNRLY